MLLIPAKSETRRRAAGRWNFMMGLRRRLVSRGYISRTYRERWGESDTMIQFFAGRGFGGGIVSFRKFDSIAWEYMAEVYVDEVVWV